MLTEFLDVAQPEIEEEEGLLANPWIITGIVVVWILITFLVILFLKKKKNKTTKEE